MALPWFRMYAEFATDPVVQSLSFDDQRHFVMALCLKGSGVLDKEFDGPHQRVTVLKRAFGLDNIALADACERLMGAGLVDCDWQPTNWEKRQFSSDHDAAERKRKQRLRESSRASHNDVTTSGCDSHALDTDADTNKEKKKRPLRGSSTVPDGFVPDASYALKVCPEMDVAREGEKFCDYEFKKPRVDWQKAWRNWVRTCKETGKYARKSKLPPGFEDVEWN